MNGFAYLDFSYRAVWGIVKLRVAWVALALVGNHANLHDLSRRNLLQIRGRLAGSIDRQ